MTSFNLSSSEALKLQLTTAISICEAIDSPRSLAVALLLRHGEFRQYVGLTINASNYEDVSNFADDYLVTEMLRKSPYMPLMIDRVEVATESFWISELQCAVANDRIKGNRCLPQLFSLRRIVADILGPLTKSDLEFVSDHSRHGPGSCIGFVADRNLGSKKFDTKVTLTVQLLPFYKALMGPSWHAYHKRGYEIEEGNRFTTVPKDAKTDRGICVEPMLNVFGQKGIGALIRGRLKRSGVDLRHQQDENRRLASLAQKEGLATIDLSRASDTVCSQLVMELIPHDWLELLFLFRSHRTVVKTDKTSKGVQADENSIHELEKWSSMGNAYTFELETLLFLAFVRSIVPRQLWHLTAVFGDDLILPKAYAKGLIDTLEFFGFKVNVKKTFLEGRFFESCGTDWFDGHDVRPFYMKEFSRGSPPALQLANRLRLYLMRRGGSVGSDSRFKSCWFDLCKQVPPLWRRCKVPPTAGDTGLVVSLQEAPEVQCCDRGWEGHKFRFILMKPVKKRNRGYSYLLHVLSHGSSSEAIFSKGREPVKGLFGIAVPKTATVQKWPDGLTWT